MKICRIALVFVLGVFVLGEAAVAVQQVQERLLVSAQRANIRDMPSLKGEVLFQVSRDEALRLIEKAGDWYFVETSSGRRGYISAGLVRLTEPQKPEPKVSESTPAITQKPSPGILGNPDVVAMAKAGLSDSIIIAAIRQSDSAVFNVSPAGLIALKNGGVSEAVIQAVIDRSALPGGVTREVSSVEEGLRKSEPASVSQQAPPSQPQVRNPSAPGRFGAGFNLSAAPGGAVPSILYDLNGRLTLNAAFGFYTGVTGVMGGLLYRFPQPRKNPPSEASFEPYLGGGLILVSVDSGLGLSESFTGFVGSGGTFLTFRKIPRWRFGGDISFVRFNVEGIAVAGLGTRLGFHYFF